MIHHSMAASWTSAMLYLGYLLAFSLQYGAAANSGRNLWDVNVLSIYWKQAASPYNILTDNMYIVLSRLHDAPQSPTPSLIRGSLHTQDAAPTGVCRLGLVPRCRVAQPFSRYRLQSIICSPGAMSSTLKIQVLSRIFPSWVMISVSFLLEGLLGERVLICYVHRMNRRLPSLTFRTAWPTQKSFLGFVYGVFHITRFRGGKFCSECEKG